MDPHEIVQETEAPRAAADGVGTLSVDRDGKVSDPPVPDQRQCVAQPRLGKPNQEGPILLRRQPSLSLRPRNDPVKPLTIVLETARE